MIEAVVAHSERPGLPVTSTGSPRRCGRWWRTAAKRLWRDDIAYAERRYALRAAHGA